MFNFIFRSPSSTEPYIYILVIRNCVSHSIHFEHKLFFNNDITHCPDIYALIVIVTYIGWVLGVVLPTILPEVFQCFLHFHHKECSLRDAIPQDTDGHPLLGLKMPVNAREI